MAWLYPHGCVVWESVQMRQFGEQSLPTRLVITDWWHWQKSST